MEASDDASDHAALLDQFSDPSVRMDHRVPQQRDSGQASDGARDHGCTAEALIYVSGGGGRHDLCAASVHDPGGLFQRRKNGLAACGCGPAFLF